MRLAQAILYLRPEDHSLVEQAVQTALRAHEGQKRTDGTPYATHALAVALILAEWGADAEMIAAGLLHDTLEDTELSIGDIKGTFGRAVTALVEGVTKFTQADFAHETALDRKIETLRKLFEMMRRDIRVVLIKLADRLHNVRTIDALPAERRPLFARETLDIYSKLAYHLGMNDLRREFSERCLPHVAPEEADELRGMRAAAVAKGHMILLQVEKQLHAADRENNLLALRLHEFSLSSLQRERRETGGIKQGFALMAIARDRDACYALLKLFHTLYRPLSGEFHDYIAAPTESAYQSIRTTVLGPGNELVPLRICTAEMDEQEQQGVLLQHFKGDKRALPGFSWLERSESLDRSTRESSEAFFEALQSDIFQETISVVVDGRDMHLPRRATVLDALYARHGKEAEHTQGVRVNGNDARLGDALAGEEVILACIDSDAHVSFDWLGWIETRYARTLIVTTLKERDHTEKISLGQRLLQKELDYEQRGILGDIPKTRLQESAQNFRRENFEGVLSLIGEGVLPARDVIFHLFPERRYFPLLRRAVSPVHPFRLHITGAAERQQDVLPKLYALTKLCDVEIKKTDLHFNGEKHIYDLSLQGRAPDRLHFADFLSLLDRQNWTSNIVTLISYRQKFFLAASLLGAFAIILLDILLLPAYHRSLLEVSAHLQPLLQALPLFPILAVNYYFLRLLRHYVVRMRTDRWFVGLAFFLNLVGLLLILSPIAAAEGVRQSLLPIIALFLFSMLSLGYRFFQTEMLFLGLDESKLRVLSGEEWRTLRKQKIAGYAIRLSAVVVWGIQPLYLKYTPANDVHPLVRVFLTAVGVLLINGILLLLKQTWERRPKLQFRIPWSVLLVNIIIGQALFTYFLNASLQFTTSTNFILFNNFSPVLALLVAAVLWRQSIPYLRLPKHMLWVFLLFLMGSTGSALIIYNGTRFPGIGSLQGDVLSILAMAADTLLVVSMIRYMKVFRSASSLMTNITVFSFLAATSLPLLAYFYAIHSPIVYSLTLTPVLFGMGGGVLSGIGKILNYEAFRRIDGFIAFLMFNISILITFVIEVFFLGKFSPTWLFLLGGIIIVSSSILAEFVNSHCQKRGL